MHFVYISLHSCYIYFHFQKNVRICIKIMLMLISKYGVDYVYVLNK